MITTPKAYEQFLTSLATDAKKLCQAVIGEALPLNTLTIFSHTDEEFEQLEKIITGYGQPSPNFSHGLTLYVDSHLEVAGDMIRHLGIRRPDPNKPQRGYGDFPVIDLEAVKRNLANNQYVKFVESGRGQPMLELRHPDFDVLGYIVSDDDH